MERSPSREATSLIVKPAVVFFAACVVLLASPAFPDDKQPPSIAIHTSGPETVVFEGSSQGCDSNDIPDAALRAFRRSDGSVVAFASHWTNMPFLVDASLHFRRVCSSAFIGSNSVVPEDADDVGWLAAFWKLPNSPVVIGIIHNEYQGNKHPGRCRYSTYAECWTNTLTMAISNNDGAKFVLQRPNHIVAAGPTPYDKAQGARYGYHNPSNIIFFEGFYYMAASAIDLGGVHRGACLMRTKDVRDPKGWRGWDGTHFTISLSQSASGDQPILCRSPTNVGGLMGSFLKVTGTNWVVSFSLRSEVPNLTKGAAITYTASSNMVDWTKPKVLMELEPYWGTRCDKENPYSYNYPSVVDFDNLSENFDETGKNPSLFLSRAALVNCGVTMSRDLVKIPLTIQLP